MGRWLLLLAFFFSIGGHFLVLQTVAWAGMLQNAWAQSHRMDEAVVRTFDGHHPCAMCLKIEKQRETEKRQKECRLLEIQKEALPWVAIQLPVLRQAPFDYPLCLDRDGHRTEEPALRPPRV